MLPRQRRISTAAVLMTAFALGLAACGSPASDDLQPVSRTASPVPTTTPTTPTPLPTPTPSATAPAPTTTAAPARTSTPAARPTTQARPAPPPPTQAPKGKTFSTLVTFYAAFDNDPPGSREIAFPGTRHDEAGGTGTYQDPLTMAADPDVVAVGTLVYYPALQKYFVMEDICASCSGNHIDLWTGAATDSGVTACQEALTPGGDVDVEMDPPPGRPVDTAPLYDDGQCIAR